MTESDVNEESKSAWLGLAGRVCVVTGAGSGIGAETARYLAAAGAHVAVLDREAEAAARVATEIESTGGRAVAVAVDVSDAQAVTAAATQVEQVLGPCRILINNAAVRNGDLLLDIGLEAWNRVLSVNLTGALLCSQVFARQMIAAGTGGSLVHIASITAHHPQRRHNAYTVSKAGLLQLSMALSLELAPDGIRSNVVSPGFTRTPANEHSYRDPQVAAARKALIPAGRVGTPVDLAQVIAFLASDRADYVSGQDVVVDGGFVNSLMSHVPEAPKKS